MFRVFDDDDKDADNELENTLFIILINRRGSLSRSSIFQEH